MAIYQQHLEGINRSRLARREGIGARLPWSATSGGDSSASSASGIRRAIPRCWASTNTSSPAAKAMPPPCATCAIARFTTSCSAARRPPWKPIFSASKARPRCAWCAWIWPASIVALVRKHFPNARIVADRFHVIRLINHHFLACWKELDPVGSKNRGLLSLMRRHRHNLKPEQQIR